MKKKLFLGLLLGLAIVLAGCKGEYGSTAASGELKEFSTVISGYKYAPESIVVNLGDTVRINIKNDDAVTHGISLPGFGVREFVKPRETKTIQFVANKRGKPETFCSTDHGERLLIEVI